MTKPAPRRRTNPAPKSFFTRRASVRGSSFDAETGTFSAVVATGTPVPRRDFNGDYLEVLSVQPGAVRMRRLASGAAPLLDSHRFGSTRDKIGLVTDARIENGQVIIEGRLSPREDVKPIAADFAGGTPPNVSIGYRVHASKEHVRADGMRVVTHTDWEPHEVSFVALPADPATHVRSESMDHENDIIENDDTTIDNQRSAANDQTANRRAMPQTTMSDSDALMAYNLCARYDFPADFARSHIDEGATLGEFRSLLISRAAQRQEGARINNRTVYANDADRSLSNPEFLGETIGNVLYAKMGGGTPAEGPARELMGRSMIDLGAMLLESRGERVKWSSRMALAERIMTRAAGSMSTSDFPSLLTGAGNRVLLDAYKVAECPLKSLARQRNAPDFRNISLLRVGEAPRLLEVKEGGEVTSGASLETKEGFRVKKYARKFGLTIEAIVNDDLGAFEEVNRTWGRATAETEADLLVSLFTANGGAGVNLDDGNPLYTTTRGNKAESGDALNEHDSLSVARQAMRTMKGLDGVRPISVTPRHLVVGPELETEGEKILAAIAAAKTDDVNPFAGKMTLHVEPRFAGRAWRLFADPAEISTIITAYLDGREGPSIDVREGWDTVGAEFRCVLYFGCGINDWRGTYLNPGA